MVPAIGAMISEWQPETWMWQKCNKIAVDRHVFSKILFAFPETDPLLIGHQDFPQFRSVMTPNGLLS